MFFFIFHNTQHFLNFDSLKKSLSYYTALAMSLPSEARHYLIKCKCFLKIWLLQLPSECNKFSWYYLCVAVKAWSLLLHKAKTTNESTWWIANSQCLSSVFSMLILCTYPPTCPSIPVWKSADVKKLDLHSSSSTVGVLGCLRRHVKFVKLGGWGWLLKLITWFF